MVVCHYLMLGNVWIAFWSGLGVFGSWTVAKLCKFCPSESLPPRLELQKLV